MMTDFTRTVENLGRAMDALIESDRLAYFANPSKFMLTRVNRLLAGYAADKRRAISKGDGTAMAKALNGISRLTRIKTYLDSRTSR